MCTQKGKSKWETGGMVSTIPSHLTFAPPEQGPKSHQPSRLHGGQAGGAIQRNLVSQQPCLSTTFSCAICMLLKQQIRLHSMISMISVTLLAVKKKKYEPGCHQPLFRQNSSLGKGLNTTTRWSPPRSHPVLPCLCQ